MSYSIHRSRQQTGLCQRLLPGDFLQGTRSFWAPLRLHYPLSITRPRQGATNHFSGGVVSERLILASCLILSSEFSLFPAHCIARFLSSCYSCSWAPTAGRNSLFTIISMSCSWSDGDFAMTHRARVSMPTSSFDAACPIRPHCEQRAYVLEWALPSIVLSHWGHCSVRAWDLVCLQPRVLRLSLNTWATSCSCYLVKSVCLWKFEFPHLHYANELGLGDG